MTEFDLSTDGSRPLAAWPGSGTAIVGVVGFPVRHSLSPVLHNAALAALGIDWGYVAFEVPETAFEAAVAGAVALGLRGLSVTMPHKDSAARLATRRSRTVRRLGAANTLTFEPGAVLAESFDGRGLLDDLRSGVGFDPAGRRCGVIGSGGAGRSAVLALAEAGAAEIVIVNRTVASAWRSVALAPNIVRVGRPDELAGMDLVVQATPAAMGSPAQLEHEDGPEQRGHSGKQDRGRVALKGEPAEGRPEVVAGVDPAWFGPGQVIFDVIYDPPLTPFLAAAAKRGATVRNGLGMLVSQAALQIRLWTGLEAPLGVMWAAVGGDKAGVVDDAALRAPAPGPGEGESTAQSYGVD
ncbi:MAG: shikimate dehydrogenase [Acidimicrobiales bacterium]|jgi:shikimate dehydrogenase